MSPNPDRTLVRAIGRWSMVALVINAVVGGGVFSVPAEAARMVGNQAVWAWVIGGLANGLIMACFAEVASRFREAGGAYLFARTALGRFAGVQIGWMSWLVRILSAAAVANVFVAYLGRLLPVVQAPGPKAAVLAAIFGTLAAVNVRGVNSGTLLSNVVTVAKLTPLIFLAVVGGVMALVKQPTLPPAPELAHPEWLRAILFMGYAFGGYDTAMMPLSESKDPQRDVPFALGVALAVMLALFTSIQAVTTYWLPNAAASQRPLADAAQQFLGTPGALLVVAGALVSTFGHLSANTLGAPRVTFGLAENGDFPALFGRVHPRFRTPWISIVVFALVTWAFAAFGGFRWNAFVSSAGRLLIYGSVAAALIVLRRTRPEPAPFTLPAGNAIALLTLAICVFLLFQMSKWDFLVIAVTVFLAAITWALGQRRTRAAAGGATSQP